MSARRQIVPTQFGHVHLRSEGPECEVPLVLLHMSPRSSQMYERLQAQLGRRSIAVDRLGYGHSDAPARALSMVEYAMATVEALDAAGVTSRFDVLGMHTGSLEALEIGHLVPQRVRRIGIIAIPVFTAEERAGGIGGLAHVRVTPVEDGSHLLEAWRARFAYRTPPYDLADVQRRLVDFLRAPLPAQAYSAACAYDAGPRLQTLPTPLVAFDPRDDVHAVTVRSRALLPPGAVFVDLPDFDLEFLRTRTAQFVRLLDEHLPA
jgi:pimeloyl-ACP methyl ester carboxylesterase